MQCYSSNGSRMLASSKTPVPWKSRKVAYYWVCLCVHIKKGTSCNSLSPFNRIASHTIQCPSEWTDETWWNKEIGTGPGPTNGQPCPLAKHDKTQSKQCTKYLKCWPWSGRGRFLSFHGHGRSQWYMKLYIYMCVCVRRFFSGDNVTQIDIKRCCPVPNHV